MPTASSNRRHESGNFELNPSAARITPMHIKHAIRLPLPHMPDGNNGSGFAYSLAADALALHQTVQRELLLANIHFSTLAKHATHPSGEMDRLATRDLQC